MIGIEFLKKTVRAVRIPAAIGILLFPTVAAADPASALLLIGSVLTKTAVAWVGYTLIAGTIIYGTIDARRRAKNAAENARNARNATLEDRSQTIMTQLPPWTIRYGRTLAGSSVHAVFTSDKTATRDDGTTYTKRDAYKHVVYVHAAHQCSEIHGYVVNGVEVGQLDSNGWATNPVFRLSDSYTRTRKIVIAPSGTYVSTEPITVLKAWVNPDPGSSTWEGNYTWNGPIPSSTVTVSSNGLTLTNPSPTQSVNVEFAYKGSASSLRISSHLGSPSQTVDTYLNGLFPDKWTTNHRLRGRCYSVVTFDLENLDFQGGIPQFQADLDGRLVYDPRSSTTYYTPNWALCVRDFITAPWGANADAADVADADYTVAAANASDVLVPISTKSYTNTAEWLFTVDGDALGWTAANASLNVASGRIRVTATAKDPMLISPALSFAGSGSRYVRVRIRRLAGATWQGACYYSTSGAGAHGYSEAFHALKPVGLAISGDWQEVVFDMHSLRNGGNDWKNGTITSLRFDFGTERNDIFDVDWIALSNESTVVVNQPKYTVNGIFRTDEDRESALNAMIEAGAGMVHNGGDWLIQAGAWSSPVMTVNDSHVDGQIQLVQADAGLDELFNGVRATYFEVGKSTAKDMKPYLNSTFVSADGEELWEDVAYPFTDNEQRCRNLSRIRTEQVRSGQIIQIPGKLDLFPIRVGDRITVNNSEFGFVNKTYMVTDFEFGTSSPIVLNCQEDSAAIWNLADQTVFDQTPNTTLQDPRYVRAIKESEITVSSGTDQLIRASDGTITVRVLVEWDDLLDAYMDDSAAKVRISWRRVLRDKVGVWRRLEVPAQQKYVYLIGASATDTVVIGVQAKNTLGFTSGYTYVTHEVVGETEAPPDVAAFTAIPLHGSIEFTWTRPPDLDYSATELRVGASWAAGTRIFRGAADRYSYAQLAPASVTVWAKHFDRTQNESANAVSATASSLAIASINNYDFTNGTDGWIGIDSVVADSAVSGGFYGVQNNSAQGTYPRPVPVDTNRTYRVSARVRASGGDITLNVGVRCFNSAGAGITNTGGGVGHVNAAVNGATVVNSGSWIIVTGIITGEQPVDDPTTNRSKFFAGTVTASPHVYGTLGAGEAIHIDYAILEDITQAAEALPGPNLIRNPELIGAVSGGTTAPGWTRQISGTPTQADIFKATSNPTYGPPWNRNAAVFQSSVDGASEFVRWYTTEAIEVDPEMDYNLSCWVRQFGSDEVRIYIGVICYDSASNNLGSVHIYSFFPPATANEWVRYSGVIGPSGKEFLATTAKVRVQFYGAYNTAGTTYIGQTLATRFCFNEGKTPNSMYAPFDPTAVTTTNAIRASNVAEYIPEPAIGDPQISDINADKINAGSIRGINVNASSHTTKGSYITAAVSAAATTVPVKDTSDFPTSGTAHVIDTTNDRDSFTYTGKTATSLTGCAGVLAHTSGATIIPFSSATSHKNVVIDSATNQIRIYGDRGDGVIGEIASMGSTDPNSGDNVVVLGRARGANLAAYFYTEGSGATAHAVQVNNSGTSSLASGMSVGATGGAGIVAGSDTNVAARLLGNATKGHVQLDPLAARPSSRTANQIALIYTTGGSTDARTATPKLMYTDGTNWRLVSDDTIWNG